MSNPTWGYRPTGEAKIFDLADSESLPDGWEASPACITDPALATADALTSRIEGAGPVVSSATPLAGSPAAMADAPDGGALASALAEIDRLTGIIATGSDENAKLIADIEAAETAVDKAAQDLAGLRTALAAAETDRAAALAAADVLASDLTAARADLEALTAPAEPPASTDAPATTKTSKAAK